MMSSNIEIKSKELAKFLDEKDLSAIVVIADKEGSGVLCKFPKWLPIRLYGHKGHDFRFGPDKKRVTTENLGLFFSYVEHVNSLLGGLHLAFEEMHSCNEQWVQKIKKENGNENK